MRSLVTFEATAEVMLAQSTGCLPDASSPESFGFIITLVDVSFSAAVVPNGSGYLVPGEATQVRLRFLVPEAASRVLRPGSEFLFFEQHRVGSGRVLSVHHV